MASIVLESVAFLPESQPNLSVKFDSSSNGAMLTIFNFFPTL